MSSFRSHELTVQTPIVAAAGLPALSHPQYAGLPGGSVPQADEQACRIFGDAGIPALPGSAALTASVRSVAHVEPCLDEPGCWSRHRRRAR